MSAYTLQFLVGTLIGSGIGCIPVWLFHRRLEKIDRLRHAKEMAELESEIQLNHEKLAAVGRRWAQ